MKDSFGPEGCAVEFSPDLMILAQDVAKLVWNITDTKPNVSVNDVIIRPT
jgi:NADP-dependent 3-hydroxy acid dehydrogenase YdfG